MPITTETAFKKIRDMRPKVGQLSDPTVGDVIYEAYQFAEFARQALVDAVECQSNENVQTAMACLDVVIKMLKR